MFTGIVQGMGRIIVAAKAGAGMRLTVEAGALDTSDIVIGDSVAVSGCCLTVVAVDGAKLSFDVSAETLHVTARLDRIGSVNLEKSLRLADRLGGHLMAGHVDGVGLVTNVQPIDDGGSVGIAIEAPAELARFIAPKGSIGIDGVSLTTNDVAGPTFTVNLIPHTLAVTTLGALAVGTRVNLEIDMVARYVARLTEAHRNAL